MQVRARLRAVRRVAVEGAHLAILTMLEHAALVSGIILAGGALAGPRIGLDGGPAGFSTDILILAERREIAAWAGHGKWWRLGTAGKQENAEESEG
jgi:hypothetical protein